MTKTIQRRHVNDDVLDPQLHPILDRIYRSRNIRSSQELENSARGLLHYRNLKDVERASSILFEAIRDNKSITIIGDFDADGATSTVLSVMALKAMGASKVDYLVPNRFNFGYGLSPQIVELAHSQGSEIIVTVDSGIACFDGVSRAKGLGLNVIVTDHHLPAKELPNADAIVNPNRSDCEFSSKHLAGVGVAFYLMSALRVKLNDEGWFTNNNISPPNMAKWLDIVAIGTVADVVPFDKNNRILVHQGLQRIKAGQCRPGISAMLAIANRSAKTLTASDLGFIIGPRLNAAGRLEDMAVGIECLLADDIYKARELAAQLDALNQSRKLIEAEMREDAEKIIERVVGETKNIPNGLVAYDPSFHQGVIGIVAGRLKEKFNRPTVTFAQQDEHNLKGSARSIANIHIRDIFESMDKAYPHLIDKFGGHAMAAGLSIKTVHLAQFTEVFNQTLAFAFEQGNVENILLTDGELTHREFTLEFASFLKQAGPFGQGFEAPTFDNQFRVLSQRIVGQNHLKLSLQSDDGIKLDGIAFNIDTEIWPNSQVTHIHAVYSTDVNVFRDKTSLQLLIHHLQPC